MARGVLRLNVIVKQFAQGGEKFAVDGMQGDFFSFDIVAARPPFHICSVPV
jgi:hypothetical protein